MTDSATRTHPRREGDPVPEVLGMRVSHRIMLRDAARLTALAEQLAAGATTADRRRSGAVAAYVRDWVDSVHHHHTVEDELLWPVVVASAGPHVELSELSDDHAALDPALDRLRRVSSAFAARPDEDTATAMAVELAELRDALAEHVREEEDVVLPVVQQYVSVRDWDAVERAIRARASLSFELPRLRAVVTAEEWPVLVGRAGPVLRVLLAVLGPAFRRRERTVFGV